MSNREFHNYPKIAYLVQHDMKWGSGERFKFYTQRPFALKAAGTTGVVFELPMPDLSTLVVIVP